MGNYHQTQTLLYVYRDNAQSKINEASNTITNTLKELEKSLNNISIAKPQPFIASFNPNSKHASLRVSDAKNIVTRQEGSGGYPMCLTASPFNPLDHHVRFRIDKVPPNNKLAVCVGVCLGEVVKGIGFGNCNGGTGKGIYAIDQNYPYNKDGSVLASWNHHDSNFNQTNVGNNDLVGWTFGEGDTIRVELDYYNSVVVFMKNDLQPDSDE